MPRRKTDVEEEVAQPQAVEGTETCEDCTGCGCCDDVPDAVVTRVGCAGACTPYQSQLSSLYRKMSEMREEIVRLDWAPDKQMKIAGAVVPYLSVANMKAKLAPMFSKHGLEFNVTFVDEPKFVEEARQWVVGLKVSIIDVDTGYDTSGVFYGNATGDKGITVAASYALKMYFGSTFNLADGIDPDGMTNNTSTVFVPKSRDEVEEVKSKVLAQGVPPSKPAPPEKHAPTPAPAVAPAPASTTDKPASPMQLRTIANVVFESETKVKEGKMTQEEFDKLKAEAEACKTVSEARAFISKSRGE